MINNIIYFAIIIIFLNVLLFRSSSFIYGTPINNIENKIIRNKRYFDAEEANREYWKEFDRNQTSTTRKPSVPVKVPYTTPGYNLNHLLIW